MLLDIWMPDTDGISLLREWQQSQGAHSAGRHDVRPRHGRNRRRGDAARRVDYVEKPLSLAKLLRTVQRALDEGRRRRHATRTLVPPLIAPVGRSRLMRDLREQVKQIAPHDAPVLVLGEPGTGREAFARYIHALSARATGPIRRPWSRARITEGNAEEILYGTERRRRAARTGVLEQAQGGVLFINGLEDLSAGGAATAARGARGGQRSCARADSSPMRFDARIVSSAQPGFETRGAVPFRLDLLSNLNVLTLRVPPLREYAEDVPELLRYYVDRLVDDERLPFRRFGVAAQNRLRNYPWPGNIRELKNLVHRLLIQGGPRRSGSRRSSRRSPRRRRSTSRWSSRTCSRCRCARPASISSAPISRSSCSSATARSASSPSASAWSARTCTGSCAASAWISGSRKTESVSSDVSRS